MDLGRSGSPAASVASRPAAQQYNQISRIGGFTYHILPWRRTHNRANLHALSHIIRMVNLFHVAGCQSNLVAIGAVAAGRSPHQLLLGQLSL